MSPLAEAIYGILRGRVGRPEPRITYAGLAEELRDVSEDFEFIHHRNRVLYVALGEVGRECRRLRLPLLPALVVRADTGRPGQAYFESKRGRQGYRDQQIAAWQREVEAVKAAAYPPRPR
jgi:hypothetical protein